MFEFVYFSHAYHSCRLIYISASHDTHETRATPSAIHLLALECKVPASHLHSFLLPSLWLNADLLIFKAVFLSDLSAQIPDLVVVVVVEVGGCGV